MTDTVKLDQVLQIGTGFWASKTLLSAVEVGAFTEPADLAALSRWLGLHERSARDFLDALVAFKSLERQAGIHRNTAAPLGPGITDAGTFHYTAESQNGPPDLTTSSTLSSVPIPIVCVSGQHERCKQPRRKGRRGEVSPWGDCG
jgi:hypothetical protein